MKPNQTSEELEDKIEKKNLLDKRIATIEIGHREKTKDLEDQCSCPRHD